MAMPSVRCIDVHSVDHKRNELLQHYSKRLRTGEMNPSCSWAIQEGKVCLHPVAEALIAMASLQDAASMI